MTCGLAIEPGGRAPGFRRVPGQGAGQPLGVGLGADKDERRLCPDRSCAAGRRVVQGEVFEVPALPALVTRVPRQTMMFGVSWIRLIR